MSRKTEMRKALKPYNFSTCEEEDIIDVGMLFISWFDRLGALGYVELLVKISRLMNAPSKCISSDIKD